MHSGQDLERAKLALSAIPPDLPRPEWVKVGMAAQAAGLSFEDFDSWSAGADCYEARAARDTWRSFEPGKGIGAGTLFHMATQYGGDVAARHAPVRPPRTPQVLVKVFGPRASVGGTWKRCKPASEAHPYIVSKQGTPDGLREVTEGYRKGWLAVPVVPLDSQTGEPVSIQYIPPPEVAEQLKAQDKPTKPNHKDAPMSGVFVVGALARGEVVYVCEGIGQAWACWKATGRAAVVCFGWGRVGAVAGELRQRDESARLVLVPDVGKEEDAERIAREVRGQVIKMPDGWEQNTDVNDYAQREGFDALEVLLSSAQAPAQRFRLLGSNDLRALPPLAWRVRGVLPAEGLASIYGPSGSGKSFLVFDMAAAIAGGRVWFGYKVKRSPVVYCALEGEAGFRVRVAAWEQANGGALPNALRLVLQPFRLTEAQDVQDLASAVLAVGDGAVTILDTLNRAAPEADENASADMGRILEAARELQRLTAGLVLVVHHTGKDATKGLRGHSSLFAALDAAVEVQRSGEQREWRLAKAKDGEDGATHPFRLQVVELPPDEEGEPVSSCVVRPDEGVADVRRVKLPQGGNQRIVLEALRPLFTASPNFGKGGAPGVRPCIGLEAAITSTAGRLTCPSDRRNERAREAITGLVARGVLGCGEGWIWLV